MQSGNKLWYCSIGFYHYLDRPIPVKQKEEPEVVFEEESTVKKNPIAEPAPLPPPVSTPTPPAATEPNVTRAPEPARRIPLAMTTQRIPTLVDLANGLFPHYRHIATTAITALSAVFKK